MINEQLIIIPLFPFIRHRNEISFLCTGQFYCISFSVFTGNLSNRVEDSKQSTNDRSSYEGQLIIIIHSIYDRLRHTTYIRLLENSPSFFLMQKGVDVVFDITEICDFHLNVILTKTQLNVAVNNRWCSSF